MDEAQLTGNHGGAGSIMFSWVEVHVTHGAWMNKQKLASWLSMAFECYQLIHLHRHKLLCTAMQCILEHLCFHA